jgi:hypothetical protein
LGASHDKIRKWAAWYLWIRTIPAVTVEEFLELALRQVGTNAGVTKTKLRKAARLLPSGRRGLSRQAS